MRVLPSSVLDNVITFVGELYVVQDYKHNLINEFPMHEERINHLKNENDSFKALAKEYHALDHRISGLNSNGVPTTDEHYEALKLSRVQLKDQLFDLICDD